MQASDIAAADIDTICDWCNGLGEDDTSPVVTVRGHLQGMRQKLDLCETCAAENFGLVDGEDYHSPYSQLVGRR